MSIHTSAHNELRQRLDLGVNVVVGGEAGSGKSTLLADIVVEEHAGNRTALLFRGARIARETPFGLFLSDPEFARAAQGRPLNGATVAAWLEERLVDSQRPLIVVDDVGDADRASLSVIRSTGAVCGSVFVFGVETGDIAAESVVEDTGLRSLRIDVESLGIRAMDKLLTERAGGAVDAGLVAELTSWTGGNPLAAVTLFDRAVLTAVVSRVDGRWRAVSAIRDLPLSDIAGPYLARLPTASRRALDILAWCGAIPLASARSLVGADALDVLVRSGRLLIGRASGTPTVALSPAVLTRAILSRVTPFAHEEIAHEVHEKLGSAAEHVGRLEQVGDSWWSTGENADGSAARLSERITLLTERVEARLAVLYREWSAHRDSAHALPVLRILLVYSADAQAVQEIFDSTSPVATDSAEDATNFLLLRHRWQLERGQTQPDRLDAPSDWSPGEFTETLELTLTGIYGPLSEGVPLTTVLERLPSVIPQGLVNTVRLLRAELNLDAGEVLDALEHGTPVADTSSPTDLIERLVAVRADALLAMGRLDDAAALSREGLERGDAAGEPFSIKIHALGLATARLCSGDEEDAWRAVSAAIRIGASGPFTSAQDARVYALAAVLSARRADLPAAEGFRAALGGLYGISRPRMDFMREWADAEIRYAHDLDDVEAGDRLWWRGETLRAGGARLAGLLCCALIATPLSAERLAELNAEHADVRSPLVASALSLHRALPSARAATLLRLLARYPARGPLMRRVFRTAAERWLDETREALTTEAVESIGGAALAERWDADTSESPGRPAPLTEREREVLKLARAGLSNRAIADELFLSLRTVENHLYRARLKSGLSRSTMSGNTLIG